jgi:hypothetical protein
MRRRDIKLSILYDLADRPGCAQVVSGGFWAAPAIQQMAEIGAVPSGRLPPQNLTFAVRNCRYGTCRSFLVVDI